jgi:Protein of unknown function (DUF2690)
MIAMRTRSLKVAMVTAVLAAFGGAVSPAQAAVDPGDPTGRAFDFQDPIKTGCVADAETVGQEPILDSGGNQLCYVELRWSPTCQTNWARVTSTSWRISGPPDMKVEIMRLSDAAWERVGIFAFASQDAFFPGSDRGVSSVAFPDFGNAAEKSIYTDMLYSPGPAQAIGTIDGGKAAYTQTR